MFVTTRRPRALRCGLLTLALLLFAIGARPGVAQCPPLPPPSAELGSEALTEPFAAAYRVWRLPPMTGDATNRKPGGMAVDPEDPNVFFILDDTETPSTALLRVRVARDACGHVTGWDGPATRIASVPYADANLLHGPLGTFVFTEWPLNRIGQLQSWSATTPPGTTWETEMGPLGVVPTASGTAGLAWVPFGFTNEGALYTMTWGGDLYDVPFEADAATGRLTFSEVTFLVHLPNSPGGMTYVPAGSPVFVSRKLVVLEYGSDRVACYDVTGAGVPDPASRVELLTGADGAWGGGFLDPISGDLYWAAWAGDERIHVVSGFALTECGGDDACHATQWCSGATQHCLDKLPNGEPIPVDPDHPGVPLDGTCTPASGAVVCRSSVCDEAEDLCGLADGAACLRADQCRSGICAGGRCGAADVEKDEDDGGGCGCASGAGTDPLLLLALLCALGPRRLRARG